MRVLDEFTRLRGFPLTTAATALKFQTRGAFPTVSGHNRRKGWWLQLAAPACTGADRPWEESGENKRNSCVHGPTGADHAGEVNRSVALTSSSHTDGIPPGVVCNSRLGGRGTAKAGEKFPLGWSSGQDSRSGESAFLGRSECPQPNAARY